MRRVAISVSLFVLALPLAELSICLSAVLIAAGVFVLLRGRKSLGSEYAKDGQTVASIGKFTWDMNDFCRGWSITGRTGSGKTVGAIKTLMHQVFKNCPDWGGIAVDEKGSFHEIVSEIAEKYDAEDRIVCFQVRPDYAPPDWEPKAKFNLLSYPGVPWSTYAKIVVDTASSLGQSGDKGFFRTQAQIHIEKAMELLEVMQYPVTLENVYDLLTDKEKLKEAVSSLGEELDGLLTDYVNSIPELRIKLILMKHFGDKFLNQPNEQLGGVMSTIFNYLQYFTNPDISEIFCCDEGSVDFSGLDNGMIFIVSMPQKYQVERRYVNTFMKLLFYVHCLRRFDMSQEYRKNANLLIFWADEAQGIVTATDDGFADYKVIDKIREAKGTVIFAAQSTTSYYPILDEKKTEVLLLNLSNQIYFTLADPKAARLAADIIGKREYWKRSYGYSGGRGNSNYQKVEEYKVKEHELMAMKKFECVVRHCEKGFDRTVINPVS
ncbi:MAG TPA: hypothetical protein DET40_24505 [Lentisphaeria bacterium]|nr:MAG: hypothetical protein A2X45_22990 [Lentisphaerae bacterium GWF2_50_93]HCE46721.1 hypothetical protein [Lentisphaeria bacterium]